MMHDFLLSAALLLAGVPARAGGDSPAGIAARYPGDGGIGNDPDVILFEDYEDDDWKRGWSASKWERYDVSSEPGVAFAGRRCLVKTAKQGENGAIMTYDLKKGEDVVYHRMYTKIPEKDAAAHRIMGITGVAEGLPTWKAIGSAGIKPNGRNYFCVTLCTTYDDPYRPLFYPYHPDQKGNYGDNWKVSTSFPAGRWFSLEIMVKLNSPGQRDGELRMWVDGRETFARTGIRYRDVDSVKIRMIFDQNYTSKRFPRDCTFWADNRVVARRHVGPMYVPPRERRTGPSVWELAARKAREARRKDKAADVLVPYAGVIRAARERALRGEAEEAARELESVAGAPDELRAIGRGLRAFSELKSWVIEGASGGRRETVFVDFLGRPARGRLVSADEGGLLVEVMGAQVPLKWQDVSPKKLHALASKYADKGPRASEALELFARAYGLLEE